MSFGANARVVALQFAALAMLAACGASAPPQEASGEQRATPVRTAIVEPQPFRDVIQLTGTVEALNDATLSAQAAGTVIELKELGSSVEAGGIVARLDPQDARATVHQAEAALASAKAEYELAVANYRRGRAVHQDRVISDAAFQELKTMAEQARAAVEQAEADLAQAREQRAETRITAPFPGTVEERFVDQGEQVTPGQSVARVVNTRRVRIVAPVPERYINDVRVGAPVRLQFDDYDDVREKTAEVTFVGRTIDPASRTFTVQVEMPNTDGLLKPEMVLALELTREVIEDALAVPRSAIIRSEDGVGVLVVSRGNTGAAGATVDRREIVLGADAGGRVVVASGLEPGAEVVTSGQDDLAPGEAVKVIEGVEHTESVEDLPEPGEASSQSNRP